MARLTAKEKQVFQYRETARTDPYRSDTKPKGTPSCPTCKSVCVRGRWLSAEQSQSLNPAVLVTDEMKCPACKQFEDHFAQGVIELHDESLKTKKDLIMNTIHNTEKIARLRNDQARILWVDEDQEKGVTKVYVTLPELARHIGREVERSFHGTVEYIHPPQELFLRVTWQSDSPHMKHRPGAPLSLHGHGHAKKSLQEELEVHKSKQFRGRSRRT